MTDAQIIVDYLTQLYPQLDPALFLIDTYRNSTGRTTIRYVDPTLDDNRLVQYEPTTKTWHISQKLWDPKTLHGQPTPKLLLDNETELKQQITQRLKEIKAV